jgi:hypothetical protein
MTSSSISRDESEPRLAAVPPSFPRPKLEVTGLQPLFSTVAYNRTYYPPGCTPPEIYERWTTFEEIALALSRTVALDKRAKHSAAQRTKVLAVLLQRLLRADVGSIEEMRWVGRRAARLLGFEAPETALPATSGELPPPMNAWTPKHRPTECGLDSKDV